MALKEIDDFTLTLLIAITRRQLNPDHHSRLNLRGSSKWVEEVYFALRLLLSPDGNY